ncbi:MAG: TGS domain-containing protein, partial [Planctomycetota bacterium]
MVLAKLPDGTTLDIPEGTTAQQLAEKIGPGLARAALGAKVDGRLVDLSTPIRADGAVEILTPKTEEGLAIMRNSCAPVMAVNK